MIEVAIILPCILMAIHIAIDAVITQIVQELQIQQLNQYHLVSSYHLTL